MGHTPRFDIFIDNHFGIGIRWDSYPYSLSVSIALFWFTITLGIGSDNQDLTPPKEG